MGIETVTMAQTLCYGSGQENWEIIFTKKKYFLKTNKKNTCTEVMVNIYYNVYKVMNVYILLFLLLLSHNCIYLKMYTIMG